MKLAVFFDGYLPLSETKDTGQIPLGLKDNGYDTYLITLTKQALEKYHPEFKQIQISDIDEIENAVKDIDGILVYTWISWKYNELITKLKKLKKKVIIKADSDGRIGLLSEPRSYKLKYNLKRFYLDTFTLYSLTQTIFPPFKHYVQNKKIEQIETSDYVVIESPDAANNLSYFLTKNKRPDLISKIKVIPNPVSPDIIKIHVENKENSIVSIGRWDDKAQKNPKVLIKTITKFLNYKKDWNAIIIGKGQEIIHEYVKNLDDNIKKRIKITGEINHENIKEYLIKSKILFMPSRWESFGIAASESLCCGCTVVGSPIESLRFLTMQGYSGQISYSWDPNAFFASLVYEANRWENNEIDYKKIIEFWRNRLNRKTIAKQFADLFE